MSTVATTQLSEASAARVEELEDRLDADIAKVRAELENLRQERSRLSAALLSSSKVQEHLKAQQQQENDEMNQGPLLQLADSQAKHNETNIHRLAFGVTSFPFTDPAPENRGQPPLLGVRFDIPTRDGTFVKQPYYVFLKRVASGNHETSNRGSRIAPALSIHHHTIPSHIDIDSLATRFLPAPSGLDSDPDSMVLDNQEQRNGVSSPDDSDIEMTADNSGSDNGIDMQSLHLFTSHVRAALMSFHLRTDVATYLAEEVKAVPPIELQDDDYEDGLYSVQSLSAPDPDARHIRIIWTDGSLGRLKVNDEGIIDRAVVFGGEKSERMPEAERVLMLNDNGEKVRAQDLSERLRLCHEKKFWTA